MPEHHRESEARPPGELKGVGQTTINDVPRDAESPIPQLSGQGQSTVLSPRKVDQEHVGPRRGEPPSFLLLDGLQKPPDVNGETRCRNGCPESADQTVIAPPAANGEPGERGENLEDGPGVVIETPDLAEIEGDVIRNPVDPEHVQYNGQPLHGGLRFPARQGLAHPIQDFRPPHPLRSLPEGRPDLGGDLQPSHEALQ